MYPISDPANFILDQHNDRIGRATSRTVASTRTEADRRNSLSGRRAAVVVAIVAAITAGFTVLPDHVSARPLEGGGVEADASSCTPLRRLVIDAPADKVKAIVGLTGPDADAEVARIRDEVAASCS